MLRILRILLVFLSCSCFASQDIDKDSIKWAIDLAQKPISKDVIDDVEFLRKKSLDIITDNLLLKNPSHGNKVFYIFVSFSIPRKNLESLFSQAKNFGATLVLRGLKNNSYIETTSYLQEIISKNNLGIIVDPSLFIKYDVVSVPTFVLAEREKICPSNISCIPSNYDKLSGNVTAEFALRKFKKDGDVW